MTYYNFISDTDSYKESMHITYPENTEYVYSYVESRGGIHDEIVFFGLQYYIKNYLSQKITKEMVDKAAIITTAHGEPFNYDGWMYIVNEHDGKLPLSIKALPEGSVVGTKTVLATIVNTDPKCYWLTTHVETSLLRSIWYPTTVCSNSFHIKKIILEALEETGTPEAIDYKLHDFGA